MEENKLEDTDCHILIKSILNTQKPTLYEALFKKTNFVMLNVSIQ